MRVGLVCPYSLTLPGGVQGQVMGLARALRGNGVEARVLGPCDGPPPETWVTPLGNSLPTRDNGSMAAIAPDPAATLRTMRVLRDEEFDVVHVHEPVAPGPCVATAIASRSPIVGTWHRSGDSSWMRFLRHPVRWEVNHLAERFAVSEAAAETARSILGGEYQILWNGIETKRYSQADPWPASRPTIFFIGRHEQRKGLDVLIEAMSLLGPDVGLWVGGYGPDTDRLRRMTAGDERIEWLGFVNEAEKASRLRGASVNCAPSLYGESFGVVLLEAMAAGTPVVATDIDGYRRVARPGVDARMVPPGDAAALAKALSAALDGEGDTADMVTSARRRAGDFSMERLANEYMAAYRRVAA
jgi:phosphatidylinositol alpha-mannosyltransferase